MVVDSLKNIGRSDPKRFSLVPTAWGPFGLILSPDGRVAATFLPQVEKSLRRVIRRAFPQAVASDAPASLRRQIEAYFRGRPTQFNVELDLDSFPEFRRRVLEACRRVPFSRTCSYADLARAVGSPGAARAVGGAMANNPVPLIVPCHRVLRSDGSLGGFSSPRGTSQKLQMLLLENPSFRMIAPPRSAAPSRNAVVAG
ncbi:MAG: methylated-DNA--[protein]-cysteine S-methyltransferase [Phycisphaerales bacterium]|nr:methylated-DNA--[protein]-cysteine S-methyltransferase [Phycisphaerales bacterium]